MKILFLLIPLSVGLFAIALAGFFWMVRHRQFDDLDSAGWQVLRDEPCQSSDTKRSRKP